MRVPVTMMVSFGLSGDSTVCAWAVPLSPTKQESARNHRSSNATCHAKTPAAHFR